MPRKKQKKMKGSKMAGPNSGLGRAIANKYGKKNVVNNASGRQSRREKPMTHLTGVDPNHPLSKSDNQLKSITQVSSIQEFVDERLEYEKFTQRALSHQDNDQDATSSVKLIIKSDDVNTQEDIYNDELKKNEIFDYKNLPIPHRPVWNKSMSKSELDLLEQKVFLEWRRTLANTAKNSNLSMTPYEKNLQVWRQLWMVIERSHLIVLIIDARNPLAYINNDLFDYINKVNPNKETMLLINKADYLTPLQRQYWAKYFESQNVNFVYFSAKREEIRINIQSKSQREQIDENRLKKIVKNVDTSLDNDENNDINEINENKEDISNDDRSKTQKVEHNTTRVLTINELLSVFKSKVDMTKFEDRSVVTTNEQTENQDNKERPIIVGMVGYPNVGKSSVINVLWGAKKVGVAATPGKTKHFQTLLLTKDITLCDCPGLVFPTLMSSKSDLVLNGVLPIDNLTDFISPSRLMVHRILKQNNGNGSNSNQFSDVYNLKIVPSYKQYAGQNRNNLNNFNVYDVLDAYCYQRKLLTQLSQPQRTDAARVMLKDFVKGKLLYCHPPPGLTQKQQNLFYNGQLMAEPVAKPDFMKMNLKSKNGNKNKKENEDNDKNNENKEKKRVTSNLKMDLLLEPFERHEPSQTMDSVASNGTETDIVERLRMLGPSAQASPRQGKSQSSSSGSNSSSLYGTLEDISKADLLSVKADELSTMSVQSQISHVDSTDLSNRESLDIQSEIDKNNINNNNDNDNNDDEMNDDMYDNNNNGNKASKYEMTDEEFLELWKHPLEEYSHGQMGTSKRKHEKKARVLRKIEKRQAKQDRKFRHDSDNFRTGSNAVVISSVPGITPKNGPALV